MSPLGEQTEVALSREFASRLGRALEITGKLQEPDHVQKIGVMIAERMSLEIRDSWPGLWVPHVLATIEMQSDGIPMLELEFVLTCRIGAGLN